MHHSNHELAPGCGVNAWVRPSHFALTTPQPIFDAAPAALRAAILATP